MTTAHYYGLARPTSERAREAAGSLLANAVASLRRWLRMRKALRELKELDDRMLKDIGLSRSTLYRAACEVHGFGNSGHGL